MKSEIQNMRSEILNLKSKILDLKSEVIMCVLSIAYPKPLKPPICVAVQCIASYSLPPQAALAELSHLLLPPALLAELIRPQGHPPIDSELFRRKEARVVGKVGSAEPGDGRLRQQSLRRKNP